jgi:hypothetical protein
VVFGGSLNNQRHSKLELAKCNSMQSLIIGVETMNFDQG